MSQDMRTSCNTWALPSRVIAATSRRPKRHQQASMGFFNSLTPQGPRCGNGFVANPALPTMGTPDTTR
eukprot:CAMPEP_0174294942 /NCGR_PEP_ID=MMETSP0809-20121228/43110_1 /TAXON_ID=73025 ORGANISM="Eutreptiella gymnastica-like, Strain CCMP1594" /NCGR_SAMPLE_ID=MMETSP0809 /ASSEMBLY_ACC=CAM_ASM_000658 /LENGTH=67 /DNA_ID=CAMNT_0015396775 /DNA_START=266 /DNA_END=469 /DNA_ORIENTATION=-